MEGWRKMVKATMQLVSTKSHLRWAHIRLLLTTVFAPCPASICASLAWASNTTLGWIDDTAGLMDLGTIKSDFTKNTKEYGHWMSGPLFRFCDGGNCSGSKLIKYGCHFWFYAFYRKMSMQWIFYWVDAQGNTRFYFNHTITIIFSSVIIQSVPFSPWIIAFANASLTHAKRL